jgi:hypothetical protein
VPIFPFASAPDTARTWVFGASQPVLGDDAVRLLSRVDSFLRCWRAHGEPVVGACDWRYDRFLLIAADEHATGVSGCSIDSLFRSLGEVEDEVGATLLDGSLVFYRDPAGAVQSVDRPRFRELVALGEVAGTTIVFDNTVGSVGAIRRGEWERKFAGSWQERAFRKSRIR